MSEEKKRPCKSCPKNRYGTSRLCFSHWKEKERRRKLERIERKKVRRLRSKKYAEGQKKTLINKLDAAFSLLIRKGGKCLWNDGEPHNGRLECSHIFSRRHMGIRWHERNAKPLCTAHHFKWHKHPAEAAIFLSTIRTPEEIRWLKEQTASIKQWTAPELETLLAEITARL